MMKINLLILLIGILTFTQLLQAQTGPAYNLLLNNEENIEGELISINPNISYTIKTASGEILVFPFDEVAEMKAISERSPVSAAAETTNSMDTTRSAANQKLELSISLDFYYQY
ncbi:MAG: hypothetical protein AAFP19_27040, partial [Bacteroidota bacterium]